jgi:uncharacterized protein YwgA
METPQIRLKLILDSLGIDSDIKSLSNRIGIQKAIYLAKICGIDLGYSYNWYVHGPYSPELTKDYYILSNTISCGDNEYKDYELTSSLDSSLNKTKKLMQKPPGVRLSQTDWLELISSIIYWYNSSKDEEKTKSRIEREKKALFESGYYDTALAIIKEFNIIPS